MLTLPASVRILLATGPVDMRKSIDGLMALARTGWGEDVSSGHLFAFVSRRGDRVKILTFSRSGFVLSLRPVSKRRGTSTTSPASAASTCSSGAGPPSSWSADAHCWNRATW